MTEPKPRYDAGEAGEGLPIRFQGQIIKVQTMTDGAIRVTLDMSETAIEIASKLMLIKAMGGCLEIAALPIKSYLNKQDINGPAKRNHKQSGWTSTEVKSADGAT